MKDLRKQYNRNELLEKDLKSDPFAQFSDWFDDAVHSAIPEPNAMVLSTRNGESVDSRTVLLKGMEEGQFIFFTNYQSHKGDQLSMAPHCSLLFQWLPLERQVIIRGKAFKTPEAYSDAYFQSRPRGSQIGAWVSNQSRPIAERHLLEKRLAELEEQYKNKQVPRPPHWGGFAVDPDEIEFWQGRPNRLHDRILFYKKNDQWLFKRLQP